MDSSIRVLSTLALKGAVVRLAGRYQVESGARIEQVTGIDVIGAIPYALQTPTVFSAGRTIGSKLFDQGDRLLRYLASPEVAPVPRESGLEP
jgi:molybdate transport system substrate-binding protein